MIEIAEFVPDHYSTSGEHTSAGGAIHRFANPPSEVLDPADPATEGMRYRYGSMLTNELEGPMHVLSLSFVQEPELGEGTGPQDISQYPVEDVLDEFLVHVQDLYDERNAANDRTCYLEFASPDLANVQRLRAIVGAQVYLQPVGDDRVRLVIDPPSD